MDRSYCPIQFRDKATGTWKNPVWTGLFIEKFTAAATSAYRRGAAVFVPGNAARWKVKKRVGKTRKFACLLVFFSWERFQYQELEIDFEKRTGQ